jgi:hypothetical protein
LIAAGGVDGSLPNWWVAFLHPHLLDER